LLCMYMLDCLYAFVYTLTETIMYIKSYFV